MATFRASGTVDSNTAAGSPLLPGLPAGTATDDILIVLVETDRSATISIANWTQAPSSPFDSNSGTDDCRIHVYYRRATGADTCSIDISAANHGIARIVGFSGCIPYGSPFDTTTSNTGSSGNTYSANGVTTLLASETVIIAVATGEDSSTVGNFSLTNTNLTGINSTAIENGTTAGTGGQIALGFGVKTTAGATGASTGGTPNTSGTNWATWTGALLDIPITNIKTAYGLSNASVKTLDDLGRLSVKTANGLT